MNRRYFLGSAVSAAVSLRGARAAADAVRVAIIGVGGRGRALTGVFAKQQAASIECLVDVDENLLGPALQVVEKAGRKTPKTTGDMRRVFDDKAIDAVVIATPDHWHAPAAMTTGWSRT